MKILGISSFYHDAAAAIIIDGRVAFAVQEERFTRIKNDPSFPINAIEFCLKESGISLAELDGIAYYDKPFLKFERILESYYATAPKGLFSFLKSMPIWIKEKLFIKSTIKRSLKKLLPENAVLPPLYFPEHHLSHAASAFFPSAFEEALILTIDGVGEYTTTSLCHGQGNNIKRIRSLAFPHSLGLLYAAATYYLGFKINSGEYKVMGLASYGDENSEQFHFYSKQIRKYLIDIKEDGSFWMDQKYFNYMSGLRMAKDKKWEKIFNLERREPAATFEKKHQNFALAFQKITEEIVLKLIKTGLALTGAKNLCLAGGVALNCVANGKIIQAQLVEKIYVQPAAGDAGGAIGAGLAVAYALEEGEQQPLTPEGELVGSSEGEQPLAPKGEWTLDSEVGRPLAPKGGRSPIELRNAVMPTAYLGPKPILESAVEDSNISKKQIPNFENLCIEVAEKLSQGKTIGWVQDRLEFGPRALGNRSILADPRKDHMMHHVNTVIKNRETFRPFAPVVLESEASKYFDLKGTKTSPYMLFTFPVIREDIPAVTHVDGSARVQTVNREQNEKLFLLLEAFKKRTGCGVLLNTSFNVKDEPMVCSGDDALRCFMNTGLDYLVVGKWLFGKKSGE